MRYFFIIIPLLYISISSISAQAFSKLYDITNGNEYGTDLLLYNDNYVVLNNAICDPHLPSDWKDCESMISIDQNGSPLHTKIFVNKFRFASKHNIEAMGDSLLILGETYGTPDWSLYYTNFEGDSLGEYPYVFEDFTEDLISAEVLLSKGSNLYLAGRVYSGLSGRDEPLFIIKTDKQCNKIKEERFESIAPPDRPNVIEDLIHTTDGHFVMSYTTYYSNTWPEPSGKRASIIKFDDNLDTIWHIDFNYYSDAKTPPLLTALEDGAIAFSYAISWDDYKDLWDQKYEELGYYPGNDALTMYKIDKDANIIWSDTNWIKPLTNNIQPQVGRVNDLITAKNGDIIGVGHYNVYAVDIDMYWPWVFRYSGDGELLWSKLYDTHTYDMNRSFLLNVSEAENGDIVCTGSFWDRNGPWNNADHVHLLRLDSDGCFEPGCGTTDSLHMIYFEPEFMTGIEDIILSDTITQEVLISPNPATLSIYITLPIESKDIDWYIIDITGKLVLKGSENGIISSFHIDAAQLDTGMYFVKIKNKNGASFKIAKLVME